MSSEIVKVANGHQVQVEVDLEEPAMSDDLLVETLKRCGCATFGPTRIKDLARIGVHLRGVGVTKIQRGAVMVDLGKVDEVIDVVRGMLGARVEKSGKGTIRDLAVLTSAFGMLMKTKTDVQRLALEVEQAASPGKTIEEPPGPAQNFAPGKRISPRGGGNQTLVLAHNANVYPDGKPGKP